MLIEIEEKEEEEDSTGRNDDSNIFKNQSVTRQIQPLVEQAVTGDE